MTNSSKDELSSEEKGKQLPTPVGYRILCTIPELEKAYDTGLLKADITLKHEEILTTVLYVIALGPDAYKDPVKFPTGAWCKEDDFVLVRPHAGTKVMIHGKEFRLINDDTVEAVVDDPRGIGRK